MTRYMFCMIEMLMVWQVVHIEAEQNYRNIHADSGQGESSCRKQIDVLLNAMNEKELIVMRVTAEGLKKARETEVSQ